MIIREKRKHKRLVVVAGMMLLFAGAIKQPSLTAYAAEGQTTQATSQSPRWEGQGDAWRVRTQDGSGFVTNDWFQDLDGSWYMLGADGYMFSGLITDQSTGKSYLLNTEHDGTYGRMIATDGVHMVNGQAIYLTFNQNHDGTYGAITNGLSELRNTGIKQVTKNDAGMVVEGSQGTQASQENSNNDTNSSNSDNHTSNPEETSGDMGTDGRFGNVGGGGSESSGKSRVDPDGPSGFINRWTKAE